MMTVPKRSELEVFMQEAIAEARKGLGEGGIPIGSILVREGTIIGRGYNRSLQTNDPTAHAEIDCLRNCGRIRDYTQTILYVTAMLCNMCVAAAEIFRIPVVVAGEDRNLISSVYMRRQMSIKFIDLDMESCFEMLDKFKQEHRDIWSDDPANFSPQVIREGKFWKLHQSTITINSTLLRHQISFHDIWMSPGKVL